MQDETFQTPAEVVNFYTAFFDALPISGALLRADPSQFAILAASNQYIRSGGVKKEDVIGKGIFEAFPSNHALEKMQLETSFRHVMERGETHHLPIQRYDIKNEEGTFVERYWRATNAPVFASDGRVVNYILHTVEEITEQVKAERREHQIKGIEKVFDLFMHAPIVIGLVTGDDYVLEMANDEALKLWDRGKEIIGKPLLQTLPELKHQGVIEAFDQVRATREPYYAREVPVTAIVKGEEQMHFFNLIYQPYYSEGNAQATGVFTISFDVTDQVLARKAAQESEQKYRSLFESIDQGFCVVELIYDENGTPVDHFILETNHVYEQQTGLNNVHGKTARELAPGIEAHWFQSYDQALKTGAPVRFLNESTALNRWFDVFVYPVGDVTNKTVAVLFADVTERQKVEAVLRENEMVLQRLVAERTADLEAKNKELEHSNANLEEFAYAASHDMKEPIRKIHFFTDRIKSRLMDVLAEEDLRYFGRVEAAVKRMSTLIDDLLTYSHISKGINFKEPVHLGDTLQLVMEDMELIIEDKKAIIVADRLPAIQGHPRQLQQLFENLIGNSLKYGKPDIPPTVTITTKVITGKETGLRLPGDDLEKLFHFIQIKDNGIGFDQGDAERIFKVFTRLHGMTEYKGTGVGLSIARKVVENHQGYIWAESKPGDGATFSLILPVE